MYQPKKYLKNAPEQQFQFIGEHPFGTIVVQADRLLATHVPFLIEGDASNFSLYAHVANHNALTPVLVDGQEVLLIFTGAHAYVSSSWYAEKDISTWDYSAVHINAKIRLQTPKELEQSLENLIQHFEKDQANPLYYRDLPQPMIEAHLPLITGFWCDPFKMEGIAKLHQGSPEEDVNSVIQHLEQQKNPLANELSKTIRKAHGTNH